MSQGPSVKGKGNANKTTKYASFNLSQTYVGTKPETKTSTGQNRHGMQVLGRVSKKVLAPAHLPSIRKENKGNDPSVSIVTSNSGWASKKEKKEQTAKQEEQTIQEQGPTSQKQTKQVGQSQDISLRPNAGAGPKQGDGTKTWVSLQTSTGSTSQPTTTYFQKEFPKLGGEGEAGLATNGKEPQEEKAVQQIRQVPLRFQNDQKFTDGPGGPMMPRPPMAFPADQRQMFNGGPLFNRPVLDAPYGMAPMPPAMFGHGYMMPMAGRYPYPFDPNYARGLPGGQRMPVMPPKPPVAQGERPLTVRDEDLRKLGKGDDDDGDGWAGDQEEVDYNAQLKFDDSDLEEDSPSKNDKPSRSNEQLSDFGTKSNESGGRGTPETGRGRMSKGRGEDKAGKGDKGSSEKEEEVHGQPPPPTQAWSDMPQGFPGQVQGATFNQGQWNRAYPPPPFDPSRLPPNYAYGIPQWFYAMAQNYQMGMPQGPQQSQQQPPGTAQAHQQTSSQQHPVSMQPPPAHSTSKAPVPQVAPTTQDATDGPRDGNATQFSSGKPQPKRKEPEPAKIQEARRRKEEEEKRREAERTAAAQAKLKNLEAKMGLKAERSATSGDDKRSSESDTVDHMSSSVKDRHDLQEENGKPQRDRGDSEASDASRTSSQTRPDRSFSKKEVAPRFRKQQHQVHRTSSDEYPGVIGDENDYLNLPQAEGRASPAMSQSSDSFPVRRIMKRNDSARSDDASSVHSQDSWGMGQGALREGGLESMTGEGRSVDGSRHSKGSYNGEIKSAPAHSLSSEVTVESGDRFREQKGQESCPDDSRRQNYRSASLTSDHEKSDPTAKHSSHAKSNEAYVLSEVDSNKVLASAIHSSDLSKGHPSDGDTKRMDAKRHKDQKLPRNQENLDYGKGDKYERSAEKRNFKKLEKPSLKNNKVGGSKERLGKAEKDQVKRSSQLGEPKRASAWAKVVAGEVSSNTSGSSNEDKNEKESQKNLNDIQKEQEENERKEQEKERKVAEGRRDTVDDNKDEVTHRDDSRSIRGERGAFVERRDSDRRKRTERDDRSDSRGGHRTDRRGFGPRNDDEKNGSHPRDRFSGRNYKSQEQKDEESDENDEHQSSKRSSAYEGSAKGRRNDRDRMRGPKVQDKSRGKPSRGEKDEKDDRQRDKPRDDVSRNDGGTRPDNTGEVKEGDRRDKYRDKGRGKEYGNGRYGDEYYDSRRERKPGYDGYKRVHEERKRKHDGGRADYKGYKEESSARDYSDVAHRDDARKDGKFASQGEGRESRGSGSGQARTFGGRGYGSRENAVHRGDRFSERKGGTSKRRTGEDEVVSEVADANEAKASYKEKKETVRGKGNEEEIEEGVLEDDNVDGGDKSGDSACESEGEENFASSKSTRRFRERTDEDKRAVYDSRGSRDRRGQTRTVSRPYSIGKTSHRGFSRHPRSGFKESQGVRKRRDEKTSEDQDGDYGQSDEDASSDEDTPREGEDHEETSTKYVDKTSLKTRGRVEREPYRRPTRGSRGMQERRWEKDQPPRFKKQHALLNKGTGRGRDFIRGSGRGRAYTSHGGTGRERNRGRGHSQSGTSYSTRQHEEDWDNESGGSGTYHTAEETSVSTSNQETHRKSTFGRGKGYSRGHGQRGGQGSHSASQEDRSNHFLADRQQVRVGQVGTSAQASALPAAFDGPMQALKDSEVRSSNPRMSLTSKKSDRGERTSQGSYNAVSLTQSRDDGLDNTDEPPKKIPKNKSSMEIKRDFLKEFDLSNIASVVVIDDFGPATEPGATASNDDDGFVQVTSRKTQKELREKQREEVRKKQREESSQGSKSHKAGDKETSSKSGRQHKPNEIQANRVQTPVTTQATNSSAQVVTSTTQAQTSNAAMAAVGGWEPAQSLMRTSQVVSNGTGLEVGKSMTVPAPPPRVNAWQRPLNFTSSVGSVTGSLSQSKTPDPKAVGTGKPSSSSKQVAVSGMVAHPASTASAKPQMSVNVAPVVPQAPSQAQSSIDRKVEEPVDAINVKKTESKKEKSTTSTLKGASNVHTSKKVISRGTALRDKPERSAREGKGFAGRQPLVRRDKLIDRKTKREKPPRFRNITKGRMASGKDSIDEDAEVEGERAPISPLAEVVDKLVTGGSKLQGEDRAPGKRPQSFEGRNQIQPDLTPSPSGVLPTSVAPSSVSSATVGGEALAMVSRSIPVQLAVTSNVVERGDEQLSTTALRKQSKDDGSSAEEEENAKDTARSVIKSLSDDDEKALETRSLPGTPPLAVEIPEPNANGPSSDPGRTTSPAAPNSMAQEMNEMSKKVLFTKKLWDDDVSGSSVGLVGVAQNTTLTTWSDGNETSQTVIKEITAVSSQPSVSDAASDKQIEVKDENSTSNSKPEEKVAPTVTNPSAFGKKTGGEQQNVCKVKPQQQQQIQPAETASSEARGSNAPSQNQVMTSQFLIPSPYTVPCPPATSQTAKVHQGYLLPVENLNAGLQQAFLAQGDSPNFQELSQQQPISLNIHTVNQPSARSTSAIAQQQQQQQEFMRPLVVNNLYGPPTVQGGQSQLLTWQVVTTHSAHTSSSVSFQSHLQGSHSGNAFNQNVTLTNTPLFMTFDPQGAATNNSIFSTQRASSHLQQQPVGLVVQQPQSQTLPSYVGVIPGSHQSSHDHPFNVRSPHTKLAVGSSPLPTAQLHHASSHVPLGSAALARHQQLEGSDGPVHHLSSISSVSGHHAVGQRSSSQVSPGMSVLSQGMTGPVSSLHINHGPSQPMNAEGHMSSQSELMKHVNAKPFQPSSKTPPSVGVTGQQSPGLNHVPMRAHTRSTQNPLVAPVRPRPVQGRNMPSSSPTAVTLQNAGRLGGAVSPVDQYAGYIPSALQVKGQHIPSLSQHSLQGSNVQHPLHPMQGQFSDQGQIVGPSRAFNIHPNPNPVPRFARPAPGPIQRPSPVNVVNALVPPRPKVVPHHPQPVPNKGSLIIQQPSKGEHFQLNAAQPQEMFRSQQHQKMIEETKKFFQKETRSQVGKPTLQEKSPEEDPNPVEGQDEPMKFQGTNQHDGSLDAGKEGKPHSNTTSSSGPMSSVPNIKSTISMSVSSGSPIISSGSNSTSLPDVSDTAKDDNLSMAKPQPQRSQDRSRRAQRSGKIN